MTLRLVRFCLVMASAFVWAVLSTDAWAEVPSFANDVMPGFVCAAATGGCPPARVGDRTADTSTVRLEDHPP